MSDINIIEENSKLNSPNISNHFQDDSFENTIQHNVGNFHIDATTNREVMEIFEDEPMDDPIQKNIKIIRCLMSQKTYNTQKDNISNPIKIFYCKGKKIIICDSCKSKCEKDNKDNYDEYKKRLKNSFVCQCDHEKNSDSKPKNCTFHSETPEAQYCLFCDLICKSYIELQQNKKTIKYKTCDFNYIDKKLILSKNKINHIVLFPKNSKEEIDSLLDCKCSYFYHYDFYYRIVFYKKIINNFYLNPDMNLFQMFYEKRDELLKKLFKPLRDLKLLYNKKELKEFEKFQTIEGFEKKNPYLVTLLDFLNESLTKILPANTDFFTSCDSIEEYVSILEEVFIIIDSIVKKVQIEYFFDLKALLLVFYRKYYIYANIRTILLSIGLDQNTNPIHRLLFSENPKELFSGIAINEKHFKSLLTRIYEMAVSSISRYDSCVKIMEEYLYYVEIMILYKFPKEDLIIYLKNIDRVIQRLSNAKREKLRQRIETIAYYILILYNDHYISDLLFDVDNEFPNKFSFETPSEISHYIINLMFSSKKSVNEIDESSNSKKAQGIELFDLLLNENDYYLESLKSINQTKNFSYFGTFLSQNASSYRNVAFQSNLDEYLQIIEFFDVLDQYQKGFYRKEFSNETFFYLSIEHFKIYDEIFKEHNCFFKNKEDNDEQTRKVPDFDNQIKVFKYGFMQKLVIFLRNFLEISYYIKYKEPSELKDLFSAFFNLITNHFCYNNPFLLSLFFNTNMFDYFFPKMSTNSDDEFSENDQMEEEIFGKKIKIYFQFLKSYCNFLSILRNFNYKVDTQHLLQRLLSIVRYKNNIFKLEVPTVNDFLKIFILCIQVNIDKTKHIIQQEISNFLRYILTNSSKVTQELIFHILDKNEKLNYSNNKSDISQYEIQKLFKRFFKLLLKFNTHYFNLVCTNEEIFKNFQLKYEHLSNQDPHEIKYYLSYFSTYHFSNFYEIKDKFNFSHVKNMDMVESLDNLIIKNTGDIKSYLDIITKCQDVFFTKIDQDKNKSNKNKDFQLLLSFFTKVFAIPIFLIIYKVLRINDIIISVNEKNPEKRDEEIFIKTAEIVDQSIKLFKSSWDKLKQRMIERHNIDDLENDDERLEILDKYCVSYDLFMKLCYENDDENKSNQYSKSSVINIQELLKDFQEYLGIFIDGLGKSKCNEEKETEHFYKLLDKTIKRYEEKKKLFNMNNILFSIFKDKEKNSTIMKNISENLLEILTFDLKEIEEVQEENEEDEDDEQNEEKNEDIDNMKDSRLESNNKLGLENKQEKDLSINQGNLTRSTSLVDNNTNQFLKKLTSALNKKKSVGNEIININLEKNLIVFECINKLFKIDPEFFQIILVNFKKTGLLIKKITEKEMIFLLQPIVNDFYNMESYFDKNIQPSSMNYFSSVTEFLRLFCENFNKVFKSLFFQLRFEYFEPKNNAKGEEDDDEDEEEDEENDSPKTIAPLGFVVRKYYFMNLIFKIFSAILRHINYYQVKKNLVSFFIPEPPGSDYFSELFDTLTQFLVETIQGNSKENFELLNSQFMYFFRSCSQYIEEIKLENDEYPVILSKIMKITLEFFQEGEVPVKIKNNILKKINSVILSDILVYKTKALNLLCNKLEFGKGKYTHLTPEEMEVIYKELFLPMKKQIGEDKLNEESQSFYSYSKTTNSNQDQKEEEEIYYEDDLKFYSNDIINAEIIEKDHENLLTLYKILFSKKRENQNEQQWENKTVEKPIKSGIQDNDSNLIEDIENILKIYRNKKLDKTNKDESEENAEENHEEEEEEDGDEEEEKETKHLLTIIDVCTKIYQFFQIIQSINEFSDKYIKYFESAKDEIAGAKKFNVYEYINSFFIKKNQNEISTTSIMRSEIYEFYSSILKSIEIVHKIKLISNDIDSSKYEHIFKIFKLEMKVGDLGISDEDTIIRKIVFLVDPICLHLKYNEALQLIERQNFEESTTLLTYVVEQIGEFKNIINLRKNIKEASNSKEFKNFEKMETISFFYLQIISIIFALITNFRLATTVSLNVNYELIQPSDTILSIITFLHLLQLGFSVYVYFYMHYVKLSQVIEEAKKSTNKEEKEYWTKEVIVEKVLDLAVQEEILYLLWSFVFATIAFIFNDCRFLYSLLLFPIFQFIPTIQDILHAVKLRAGQFFSAGLIIVLFVFFYSIIGIYFFKDKFMDPETGVI